MGEATFIPGFETVQKALTAGEKFYAKANGQKGRFQRDFHIVENEHGRFHFSEGPGKPDASRSTEEGE